MKILILGDIHGRDFWIEPCNHIDEFDKVVFLGDYHDPYLHQVDPGTSLKRLEEKLVPFVKKYRGKVICLYGNHDNYIIDGYCCRHDDYNYAKIKTLLNQLDLQLYYEVDGYLFTHSGVTPSWLKSRKLTLEDFKKLPLNDYGLNEDVSSYRGGYRDGSPIWGDVREFIHLEKLPNYYQIFGHTQMQDKIIEKDFACLDCRQAFVLDTETKELKQWESIITS